MNTLIKRKGTAALILMLIVALVLTPLVSFGNDDTETNRKWQTGDYVQVDEDGAIVTGSESKTSELTTSTSIEGLEDDVYVKYSKNIDYANSDVDQNKFKVDLSIETNDVGEKRTSPSSVLLIFDVSTSMDYAMSKDSKPADKADSRWNIYKEAMSDFIKSFLKEDGENYVEGNMVSIVAFGGSNINNQNNIDVYEQVCDWTTSTGIATDTFYDYNYVSQSNVPETYEGGKWAKHENSFRKDYFNDDNTSYGATNGESGFKGGKEQLAKAGNTNSYTSVIYVSDGVVNRSSAGTDTAKAENAAINAAVSMKADCNKLYTFAIGDSAANSKVLKTGTTNNSAVDMIFVVKEKQAMQDQFKAIAYDITHNVHLWTVTDPMSDDVTYEGLTDNTYSGVEYDEGVLTWNLEQFPAVRDDDTGVSTYNISYYVSLDTVDGEFHPTNKITELKYAYATKDESGNTVVGDEQTAQFMIPTVKGIPDEPIPGKLSVKKVVDVDDDYLYDAGQEFQFGIKVGDSESYLSGFSYTVNGSTTTPEDGIIKLTAGQEAVINYDFEIGTVVTVEELSVPAHYSCGDADKVVTISEEDQVATITNVYDNSFVREGDVTAVKTSDPEDGSTVEQGNTIRYYVEVTNNMNTGTAVTVTDPVPTNTTYVPDSASEPGYEEDGVIKWDDIEIASGESIELYFDVTVNTDFEVTNDTTINNIASYTYDGGEGNTNEVIHKVAPPPVSSFSIEKINNPGNGEYVGEDGVIEYFITVTNTGDLDINNLQIKDTVPANTTFKEFTGNITGQESGSELTWNIGDLTLETGSVTVSFTVTVNDGLPMDTEIVNVAYTTDAEDPGEEDWAPSGPVTNLVPAVQGEEAIPTPVAVEEGGNVLGQTNDPIDEDDQSVLGEEAKTGDAMSSMPYLVGLLIAAAVVMVIAMRRMSRKED